MPRVVLLTGSNLGDKRKILFRARCLLNERVGPLIRHSRIYESEPWGFIAEENFLNQALLLETFQSPITVLDTIQAIEKQLGRKRRLFPEGTPRRYESRAIDIDILFYGDEIIRQDRLTVPHPLICQREFVLEPLREILPDYIHPVYLKPIKEL